MVLVLWGQQHGARQVPTRSSMLPFLLLRLCAPEQACKLVLIHPVQGAHLNRHAE